MDDRSRHFFVVLIFLMFGVVQLVPTYLFTQALLTSMFRQGQTNQMTFRLMLVLPSFVFAAAVLLAGVVVRIADLLPRGISFSWLRIATAAAAGTFVYPVASEVISLTVMMLFFAAPLDSHPPPLSLTLGLVFSLLFFGGMVWLVGALAVAAVALAFAFAVRCWPSRVLSWACALSVAAVVGNAIAAIVQQEFQFPTTPILRFLTGGGAFRLLFGFAGGLPLIVYIGEPLLAALLGHWLFLAAKEYADSSA